MIYFEAFLIFIFITMALSDISSLISAEPFTLYPWLYGILITLIFAIEKGLI